MLKKQQKLYLFLIVISFLHYLLPIISHMGNLMYLLMNLQKNESMGANHNQQKDYFALKGEE